jgi:hypothetical protein
MGTARRKFQFGYPDAYGAALYPAAYDSTSCATAFLQYQFRTEQQDKAPPDTAIPDSEADKAQADYRKKYAPTDLPPHSGLKSFLGFGHDKNNIDYVFFQSPVSGPGALSFREWLKKKNIDPNKFPE